MTVMDFIFFQTSNRRHNNTPACMSFDDRHSTMRIFVPINDIIIIDRKSFENRNFHRKSEGFKTIQ